MNQHSSFATHSFLFRNDGQKLVYTNYFDSAWANAGLCVVSPNAGAVRLLVPDNIRHFIEEMKTGRHAELVNSIAIDGHYDLVFEDGRCDPFFIALDREAFMMKPQKGRWTLLVYSRHGIELQLDLDVKV